MCYQVPSQPFALGVFPSMDECIKTMDSKIGCGCYLQENGIYWPYYGGLVPAAFAVVALVVGPTGWLSAILTLTSAIFAAGFLHVAYVTRTQVVHPEETIGALVWLGALTILSIVLFVVFALARMRYRRASVANAV
jgi:hypothetical protein